MGAKIGVLLNCGQQSQFSKVRREFDAGRVNLDPPMTCADWPVPGNLTLLHPQTAYTRKPSHLLKAGFTLRTQIYGAYADHFAHLGRVFSATNADLRRRDRSGAECKHSYNTPSFTRGCWIVIG